MSKLEMFKRLHKRQRRKGAFVDNKSKKLHKHFAALVLEKYGNDAGGQLLLDEEGRFYGLPLDFELLESQATDSRIDAHLQEMEESLKVKAERIQEWEKNIKMKG